MARPLTSDELRELHKQFDRDVSSYPLTEEWNDYDLNAEYGPIHPSGYGEELVIMIDNGHNAPYFLYPPHGLKKRMVKRWRFLTKEEFKALPAHDTTPSPPPEGVLPTDAAARKAVPVYSGFMAYFPDAIVKVAELSRIGNEQHNPGKPLHWDRSKSGDERDALARHLLDSTKTKLDVDNVWHATKVAWRAMADLQKLCEHTRPMSDKEIGEVSDSLDEVLSGASNAPNCPECDDRCLYKHGYKPSGWYCDNVNCQHLDPVDAP